MMFHRFDINAIAPAPWKNGGGSTREIACLPAHSSLDSFDWRVSLANVASDGPFSVFPGVDRVLTLLSGTGLRLQSMAGAPDTVDACITATSPPYAFAGETPLHCTMLDGPSTDFNVMTRRGKVTAQVQLVERDHSMTSAPQGLLLAWGGLWTLNQGGDRWICPAGTGLYWNGMGESKDNSDDALWHLTPQSSRSKLLLVQITPVPQSSAK